MIALENSLFPSSTGLSGSGTPASRTPTSGSESSRFAMNLMTSVPASAAAAVVAPAPAGSEVMPNWPKEINMELIGQIAASASLSALLAPPPGLEHPLPSDVAGAVCRGSVPVLSSCAGSTQQAANAAAAVAAAAAAAAVHATFQRFAAMAAPSSQGSSSPAQALHHCTPLELEERDTPRGSSECSTTEPSEANGTPPASPPLANSLRDQLGWGSQTPRDDNEAQSPQRIRTLEDVDYSPGRVLQKEAGSSVRVPLQLEKVLAQPPCGSAECPSVGSAGHHLGLCKPCDFIHRSSCRSGASCKFCHLCGPEENRRRKKEKHGMLRALKRWQRTADAAAAAGNFGPSPAWMLHANPAPAVAARTAPAAGGA